MSKYVNQKDIPFVVPQERPISQGKRHQVVIPGYKAIVNPDNNTTFAIVGSDYKLTHHQEVLDMMESFCDIPGLDCSDVQRVVTTSHTGGRMKAVYKFPNAQFEIKSAEVGDVASMTIESFASFDTTMRQRTYFGMEILSCSNGMKAPQTIGEYVHKHTKGLNLEKGAAIIREGLEKFPQVIEYLNQVASRYAFLSEINAYESLGFLKAQREGIEDEIKRIGHVKNWDDEEPKNRKVDINAWELYNIYTNFATHEVDDISRQQRITDAIAATFN